MPKKQEIFQSFVKSNGLEQEVDFRAGKIKYQGLGNKPMTKEEVMGTPDYAGFVDGLMGNPPKYSGPKGSPETAADPAKLLDFPVEKIIGRKITDPQDKERVIANLLESNPRIRYERQYEIGRSAR